MLYKYANINDNFTLNNLINNQLGFNRIENFNDPFDTTPALVINVNNIRKHILASSNLSDTQKEKVLMLSKSQLNSIANMTILEQFRNPTLTADKGITCFSETNDNILMWSHYSNKHEGICLGFDIDEKNVQKFIDKNKNINNNKLSSEAKYALFTIKYSDTRPVLKIFTNDISEQISNMLKIKSNIWKYEREHRIFIFDKNISFPTGIYYNREYLKEITLGANLSINNFFKLYNIIKSFDINIKICIPNNKIYKLDLYSIDNNYMKILYENLTFLKLLSLSNNELDLSILNLNKTFDEEVLCNLHQILNNIPLNILNKIFDKISISNIISFYPIIYKESIQNFNIANINSLLSFISSIASYSKYL